MGIIDAVRKRKKGKIIIKILGTLSPVLIALLCVIALVSGLFAIWNFLTGLFKSPVNHPENYDFSNYTLEKLIECADDEDIISDEYLRGMMIDRSSYKRLLKAVRTFNAEYVSDAKQIQMKHTYTTKRLVTYEESINPKNTPRPTPNPFIPDKKDAGKSWPNATAGPKATPQTVKKVKVIKEKHTDYEWKTVYVSTKDLEGQYQIDWQPVLQSVLQNFIYNYNSLVLKGKGSSPASPAESPAESRKAEGLGSEVAEYACRFLGNPYAWGGTSLTKGCDCSGFTMKVYEHFGYSLPHSSASQRNCGMRVCDKSDYSQERLMPGDIICYEGHVAIYIGNGKVVNAASKKSGICVKKIMYRRDFVCARRIIKSNNKQYSSQGSRKSSAVLESSGRRMAGKSSAAEPAGAAGADKKLVGNSAEEACWNFFKAKGLSDVACAAIMGNLSAEHGFKTDSGGIAQWQGGRWANLCRTYPGHQYELLYQLKFLWKELTGPYSKVLIKISKKDTQLAWIADNNPGAVYDFAYGYEGCLAHLSSYFRAHPERVAHDIQDYPKRLREAERIIRRYGNSRGTDGKTYYAGDTSASDPGYRYGEPAQIGKYDRKKKWVHLSDADIDSIMDDFKPHFEYSYDFVRDGKDRFTFDESKNMLNSGLKNDGGDPGTKKGLYEWYMPSSCLDYVRMAYMDVTYGNNVPVKYELNGRHWANIMSRYVPHYNGPWFARLIKLMPYGSDPIRSYEHFASLSSGESSYDMSDYEIANATGNYEAMEHVKPSVRIPEKAGGMGIPLYYQWDGRWKGVPFGGKNISSSGCSVASLAMVLSYLKNACIYPNHVVAFTGARKYYLAGSGANYRIFPDCARHWKVGCRQQVCNANAIRRALKKGHPVIVSATGYGTTTEFTKRGHFIVLRGLDSKGRVLVNDPNDNSSKKHYLKAYSAEFIVSECTMNHSVVKPMWEFWK